MIADDPALSIILLATLALLGLAVGSFLNVVIWRAPRGESLSHPASSCPRCRTRIRAVDNIPVVSWLLLRGRCRSCSEPISLRYPLVELGTAVAFVAVGVKFGLLEDRPSAIPAFLYFVAIAIVLASIDLDLHRLPNSIVLPSYPVGVVLLALASFLTGDWVALAVAAAGAGGMFAFYFALALIVPRGMGFGDVKLAGVIGLYLGWLGWGSLFVGAFAAFVLGGIFSVMLLVARRAGRKSGIPFGPWMLAGAGIAVFFGERIADSYFALVGLN